MPDFVYLPHFQVPLALENGEHVCHSHDANTKLTAIELPRGCWQLRLDVDDGDAHVVLVVEAKGLEGAEAALVKAMGRAEDVLTAALMQVSVECRHSGEVRAA